MFDSPNNQEETIHHTNFLTFRQSLDIMKRPKKFETITHLIWHLLPRPSEISEKLEHIDKVIFDIPFMTLSHAESLKKILGAVWELPAKKHSQSSQTWVEMGWIGCAI